MLVELTLCACFAMTDPAAADTRGNTPSAPARKTSPSEPAAGFKADEAEADDDLLAIERNIIQYTNYERTKRGLPPLEVDENLMKSARAHAAWMTRRRSLVHTTSPVAENIAMGQRTSRQAVRDWMNSPGHRANILGRGYRRIGAAAYRTATGTIFWCQQFRR